MKDFGPRDFYDIPLLYRLGLLVLLMLFVSLWEWWRGGGTRATRWKEYGFLLVGGAIGAVFGVTNDLFTSALSPVYFEVKGAHGVREVIELGAQAGFIAGVILAMGFLFANNPKDGLPRAPYLFLFQSMVWPIVGAVAGAVIGGLVGHSTASGNVTLDRFTLVWGVHCGVYAGALIGTVPGCVAIRRQRWARSSL